MSISTIQRQYVLAWLRDHKEKEPSYFAALAYEWPKALWITMIGALGIWLVYPISANAGLVVVGASLGLLIAVVGQVAGRLRVFRIYKLVTDWERVDQLLSEGRGA